MFDNSDFSTLDPVYVAESAVQLQGPFHYLGARSRKYFYMFLAKDEHEAQDRLKKFNPAFKIEDAGSLIIYHKIDLEKVREKSKFFAEMGLQDFIISVINAPD